MNKHQAVVFSRDWFERHQAGLLRLANCRLGRYILRVHGDRSDVGRHKISRIEPHAIHWLEDGRHRAEIRTHAKFAKRLYYAFRPLWHLAHAWDMLVANRLHEALNLGFDTLLVYPDADPETSTVDGHVARRNNSGESFATMRAGAGNEATDSGAANETLVALWALNTGSNFIYLSRAIATFDTTSIDPSATISQAYVSVRGYYKYTQLGSTSLDVVSASPASNTGLAASDYANLGSTSFGSETSAAFNTSGYTNINLSASGLSNLTLGGISRFGFRLAWDTAGSFTGTWTANGMTSFAFYQADYAGTTRDPKMTITYLLIPKATYSNSNPYASGKLRSYNGTSWSDVASGDLYFIANTGGNTTSVAYSGQDPSDILKAAVDNFNDNGGRVTYSGSSVDATGTTASYTFNTNTVLEVINKARELAPAGWYWYVDPATSLVNFHQKSGTADHYLTLGKDIRKIKVDKRTENIVNTVFFRGGDTGGGAYLYKKYQDTVSVGLYGIRAVRYTDERVTLSATAAAISNGIINDSGVPEIRATIEVSDSNGDGFGYDTESISVGDVVNIQSVPGNTNRSLWDVALWDVDRWDYNIQQLGSMYLQIVRLERYPDYVRVFCSTIPPDISKRIEQINRKLEGAQTADNPSAPS